MYKQVIYREIRAPLRPTKKFMRKYNFKIYQANFMARLKQCESAPHVNHYFLCLPCPTLAAVYKDFQVFQVWLFFPRKYKYIHFHIQT